MTQTTDKDILATGFDWSKSPFLLSKNSLFGGVFFVRAFKSSLFVVLVLAVWLVSPGREADAFQSGSRSLIVCSTTQVADFTRQVAGDDWEVRCVLAPGQDPHTYQVTTRDAKWVAEADLCIENGWELEGKHWMRTLANNAGRPIVTCVDGIAPLELSAHGTLIRDPHAWFTPKNASVYVRNITRALIRLDPDRKEQYEARAQLYLGQLGVLHNWILSQVNAIPAARRTLVSHHDAFGYFCRQYGFQSFSPEGWSTGDEVGGGPSVERRQETIDAVRKFGVRSIFVETTLNPRMIEQMALEAGVEIGGSLYSDSMGPPESAGETYLGMMRENVLTIVKGLR